MCVRHYSNFNTGDSVWGTGTDASRSGYTDFPNRSQAKDALCTGESSFSRIAASTEIRVFADTLRELLYADGIDQKSTHFGSLRSIALVLD